MTREQWISESIGSLRSDFEDIGHTLPDVIRATVGWTSKGLRSKRIGECWYPAAVGDGVPELFITPTITDGARVLDILAHELTHVVAGPDAQHGPEFKRIATAIGLTGRMTATVAGPEFELRAGEILDVLGPYPHPGITPGVGGTTHKKQSTRMLKLECPACGYVARTSQKWIDYGLPTCPCGVDMLTA